jgi:4-amino-4-deoxy-L-arabinose transferase-like glycosyltransferase
MMRVAIPIILLASLILVGPHVASTKVISGASYEPQDALLFMWNFWHADRALQGEGTLFHSDMLYHGTGTSLAFHSQPVPYAFLALPLRRFGWVGAFQILVFLSFVANGLMMYLLALRVTRNRQAAIVAALLFTFLPYRFANMARLHLLGTEFLLFAIFAMLRLRESPSWRWALGLALAMGLLFYTSQEYALFVCFLFFAWALPRFQDRRFLGWLAVAAIVAAGICTPLLSAQAKALQRSSQQVGAMSASSLQQAAIWSPALLSFFVPSRLHPVYGRYFDALGRYQDGRTQGMRSETAFGICFLLLAAVGIRRRKRMQNGGFWLFVMLAFGLLTLGPWLRLTGNLATGIPMPFRILHDVVPLLDMSRDSTRFLPLVACALALLAAHGWTELLARFRCSRRQYLRTGLLMGLILFESAAGLGTYLRTPQSGVPAALAELPAGAVIDIRPVECLWDQTQHARPIGATPMAVPRSTGRALFLEQLIRQPQPFLDLASHERSGHLERAGEELAGYGVVSVVFAADEQVAARIRVVKALGGAIHRLTPEVVICRF